MLNHSRHRVLLQRLFSGIVALPVLACASGALAQTTPIPFASTYAGLATGTTPAPAVCSASLPVFAVSGTGAKYGDGCPATQASLNVPVGVATDKYGNVFIADQTNMLIRVVYNGGTALATAITNSNVENPGLAPAKGNIYTIAGGPTATPTEATKYCNQAGSGTIGTDNSLDGCPASESEQGPRAVATDADGNIFISSVSPVSQIRVIFVGGANVTRLITLENPTITSPIPGYVYNIAGGNASSYTGDGALASKATMNTPRGLVIDASEDIYFADELNNVIRRVDGTTGFISTVAGHCVVSGTSCTVTNTSGDGSAATSSTVNIYYPYGVALDQYGNLFIAEGGSATLPGRIRVVYAAGTVPGLTPTSPNIYTYAGGSGTTGTQAQQATFQFVYGVSIDSTGYLYVTDYRSGTTGSNHIWRVDPTNGNILILAGTGGAAASLANGTHCDRVKIVGLVSSDNFGDGCPATQAYLNIPQNAVAFDANGNAYFADRGDNVVRKLNYNNVFPATAVGSTSTALPQAFYYPAADTLVSKSATLQGATTSEFIVVTNTTTDIDTCPVAAAIPATPDTCVNYLAFAPAAAGTRSGAYNNSDATGIIATEPVNGVGIAPVLAIAPAAPVVIGSGITPSGISTDLKGDVYVSDSKGKQVIVSSIAGGAGTAAITGLGTPRQSTVDNSGNLYVADSTNNSIVKLPAGGTAKVTVVSGLNAPQGVVADFFGNVYIADTGNNRILYYNAVNGNTTPVSTYPLTLSAPTSLALDAAGNLYIVDTTNKRVVEVPVGQLAVALTLPNGITPDGVAFDPAGDIYFADTTSGSILFEPVGTTTTTVLVSGLTTPTGVAVGPSGSLFVADSAATTAAGYNAAVNSSVFTTTNITLTSLPITLTLSDVGNLAATLSTPLYIETGSAAAFPAYGTATCTAAYSLVPGATCTQTFDFAPTVPGAQSATVVFSDTASQSVTANLSGTATNLILTTLSISPLNATSNYGVTTTYTVTLTPKSIGATTPIGTITFVVDGKNVSSQNVTTAPYTYTFTLSTTVAVHSVAAVYSGDTVYAGSNVTTLLTINKATTATVASYSQSASGTVLTAVVTPASVGALTFTGNVVFYVDSKAVATVPVGNGTVSATVLIADGSHTYYATYAGDANYSGSTSTPVQTLIVARAPTTTTLTITPVSCYPSACLLLSAKITSATAGTPTGTVVFSNNGATLATVNLSTAVNGVVTYTTNTTSYTNYSFTAAYSGDGLYDPSSSTVTEGADFAVITPTVTLGVPQGGQAVYPTTTPISVVPINGYAGSLTATCTGLPANAFCRFQPIPVVLTSTSTAAVVLTVQVFAGVNPAVGSMSRPSFHNESKPVLAFLLLTPAAFGLLRRRKKKSGRTMPYLLSFVLLVMLTAGMTGCGDKTPAYSENTFITPDGTYPISLTLTDTNNIARSAVFNITVIN
jgi:streptogramin lyase